VLAVELGLDVHGHVDVVDDEMLEVAAEIDVPPIAVDDLQTADLTIADLEAGEVAQVDAGAAEPVGLGVLGSHRGSLAHRFRRRHRAAPDPPRQTAIPMATTSLGSCLLGATSSARDDGEPLRW
jgi:hypothetical protein